MLDRLPLSHLQHSGVGQERRVCGFDFNRYSFPQGNLQITILLYPHSGRLSIAGRKSGVSLFYCGASPNGRMVVLAWNFW